MAGPQELFSLVTKFMKLWHLGSDAQLHIQCQAGQASVWLQLGLSLPPQPAQRHRHPYSERRRSGPSRQRRRERHAAARAAAASTAGQVADVVDASEDAANQTDAAQVSTFEEGHTENVAEEAAFEQNAPNLSYDEAEKSTEVGKCFFLSSNTR